MEAAIRAVTNGEMGFNAASRSFNVSTTTLRNRLSGRVKHGSTMGAKPYLNKVEERALKDFLFNASDVGLGKTRGHAMMYAEKVAKEKGVLRKDNITHRWFESFRKRNSDVALRKGDSMAAVRFRCTNPVEISKYYTLLHETLTNHNLIAEPWRIYNVDETGMPLDPRKPKVVTRLGTKKVRVMGSGNKHQITAVVCASATGHIIPLMIIFEGKNLKKEWLSHEVPGTVCGMSDKGWMETSLFNSWFDHFLQHAVPGKPLLLLLDGHSTHYSPHIITKAMEKDVIILCLPPHSSQDTQPLDVAVYGPLKQHWSRECHEWMANNPHKLMGKVHFNAVFSKVWSKAVTSNNVVAGFRKAGIHPFNDKAIAIPVNDEAVSHHIAESCGREPSKEMIDLPSTQTIDDRDMGGSIEVTSYGETETTENSFTPAEVQLYQHRIEEGYNVFTDQQYVQWVKLNHPALLPASLSQHEISSPLIETANENHIESGDNLLISTSPLSLSQPPSF